MIKLYEFLWNLGEMSGCHQLPNRSFFIGKYQFPVCARCTGVWIGYIAGIWLYVFTQLNIWVALLFCFIMFADWFLQYKNICPSTNTRRLITGFLCGLAYIHICLNFLSVILNLHN